jgi:hypothetical protein
MSKSEQVRMCKPFIEIFTLVSSQSWTTFSLSVSRPGVKIELAGLTLTEEAS